MENPSKHRQVRSFVRRDGRLTAGQKKALDELWPLYGIEPSAHLGTATGYDKPVVLEIGFGTGDSLAQMALENPNRLYVGIEVHRPGVGYLLKLIQQYQLENVRIYCADAVEILKHCIPDTTLDAVQIFFPDPWHKKRHHKRRLIQAPFVELVTSKLSRQGILHIATDWQEYAEHCLNILKTVPGLQNTATTTLYSQRPDSRPMTKFEQRGQRLGHEVWDLIFVKCD